VVARAAVRDGAVGRALRPRPLQEGQRLPRARGRRRGDPPFGEILKAAVRASDVAARYGGEEFAVLFPETGASAAMGVAERVRRAFEREDFVSGRRAFHATVSCGIADGSGLGPEDRDQLLFRADQALYRAKDEGRNRVRLWSEKRKLRLES
jgi:diguanylate cyclase (GGDEF)-like protein